MELIYWDYITTVRLDNYKILILKNYAALPKTVLMTYYQVKNSIRLTVYQEQECFIWENGIKKYNIVKERLSQQMKTTTQSHYVNQINQISNNFHVQLEDSKEDVTLGKQNI